MVSKFGSKEAEEAGKKIAKKLITKKIQVFTIAPISITGATQVETAKELKNKKLDLVITLGGDGTTLRTFRYIYDETPLLGINVGGNRGILSEITINEIGVGITLGGNCSKGKWFDTVGAKTPIHLDGKAFAEMVIHACAVNNRVW